MIFNPIAYAYQLQVRVLERQNRVLQANSSTRLMEADKRVGILQKEVELLQTTVQAATDSLTNTSSTSSNEHYVGNPYKTYPTQVAVLHSKYNLRDDWGCMTLKNIVDVRAAFMIGRGVQVVKRDGYKGEAKRELAFIRDFINFNNIDEEAPQDWAVGTELEGKVLIRLLPVEAGDYTGKHRGMIRAVYVPWQTHQYTITADEPNYYRYLKADYTGTATRPDQKAVITRFALKEDQFIYKRFGGFGEIPHVHGGQHSSGRQLLRIHQEYQNIKPDSSPFDRQGRQESQGKGSREPKNDGRAL